MAADSDIEWTHHTFNPWWGCVKVSPGCALCYAEAFSKRVGQKVWGKEAGRRFFGDKHWAEPVKWDQKAATAGIRHRVFCGSMCDIFEDRDDLHPFRERLFDLVDRTSHLDWLLLSKRPENAPKMLPASWLDAPRGNVWFGATAEDAKRLAERSDHLRNIPARIRFLSCEPLLEDLGLRAETLAGIDWVILGGESGGRARACEVEWIRSAMAACRENGVAAFVKQLGKVPSVGQFRLKLLDSKGGDIEEWPSDLRVREFPASLVTVA
jgi:protein gp37